LIEIFEIAKSQKKIWTERARIRKARTRTGKSFKSNTKLTQITNAMTTIVMIRDTSTTADAATIMLPLQPKMKAI
jgi:hypothetical protein